MYLFCVLCYLLILSIRQTKSRLCDNDYIIMIALQWWQCQHALFKQTTIWQQLPNRLGREGCVCEQKLVSHLAYRVAIQHNLWATWLANYSSLGLLRKHAFQKIFSTPRCWIIWTLCAMLSTTVPGQKWRFPLTFIPPHTLLHLWVLWGPLIYDIHYLGISA